MNPFENIMQELFELIETRHPKLLSLKDDIISQRRNRQNRTIKQIIGHMVDSASNNTHRIVHLQYQAGPYRYPNYATYGNNDRWIALQNYQNEDWFQLVQLWKYSNLHLIHVIDNVDVSKLDNLWQADEDQFISLKDMIIDYLRHFKLHLEEIDALLAET